MKDGDFYKDETLYVNGIKPDKTDNSLISNIEDVFLKSTNNLDWLSQGDVVLLKPALNSPHPYPSTTHPLAVHVISRILADNGAKVFVGDQSGIRSVLHHPGGVIRGKTKDNYIKAGMGAVDEDFISFEGEGWDKGFYHHISPKTPSWPNGFHITRWIEKSDHIISLPRLSTHSQAGATLGFKNMVGCLREDNRLEFHANGPYNFAIKADARGSSLKSADDHSGTFFEKIVEISDALREKLRLNLFVATKAQVTFGPDSQAMELGKLKIGRSHVLNLKPGLVFASEDPVAAESFALAILKFIRRSTPPLARLYEQIILFSNNNTVKVDKVHVKDHPYIQHSLAIGLGEIASDIQYKNVPGDLKRTLGEMLGSD
ncbi:MAG: hypothetical protein B655_0539 [Methanobacterium sp. Maddingley MBC34]|nr:MAG: hypothetical protein B655_0539 [Methanobacterium sp. Maddingley MBC34]